MIYSPTIEQCAMYDSAHGAVEVEQGISISADMSSFPWPLKEFSVGSMVYLFLRPIQRHDILSEDGWVSYIRELPKHIGKGQTADEAFEDLKINIHVDFQRLYKKRPFEMTEQEQLAWLRLTNVIDLLHYRTTTPIVMKEIGSISYGMISRPFAIEWISGKTYLIEPHKVPGDLMGCKPGQWIEAVVKRDPLTYREIEIESITKISFHLPSETEVKKFWKSLPKADVQTTDWTW